MGDNERESLEVNAKKLGLDGLDDLLTSAVLNEYSTGDRWKWVYDNYDYAVREYETNPLSPEQIEELLTPIFAKYDVLVENASKMVYDVVRDTIVKDMYNWE